MTPTIPPPPHTPAPWPHDPADLTIVMGSIILNVRVGAVIRAGNRILLDTNREQNHHFLPGGRVKAGEDTMAALYRELAEEVDIIPESATLWAVIENFFSHRDHLIHEVGFYYQVTVPSALNLEGHPTLRWATPEERSARPLYPEILVPLIDRNEPGIHHLLVRDA